MLRSPRPSKISLSRLVPVVFLVGLCAAIRADAAEAAPPPAAGEVLVIGTKEAPPFAMRQADGSWSGIAIDLWRQVTQDLDLEYEFHAATLDGILAGVADHRFDAGVAAITITAGREKTMDFSQPFYITGLGIAVPNRQTSGWLAVVGQLFSPAFLKAVLGLAALLLLAGALVWLFERRRNPEQFARGAGHGLFAGFWWAAVTMTTVGYGDKAPLTTAGRIIGIIWMFTGVIVISGFTAAIASSLTVSHLQGPVQGPADLPRARVGAVRHSTSAEHLTQEHLAFTAYDTTVEALEALDRGRLDAVVYDAPMLRYQINRHFHGRLRVLSETIELQYYGFALPPGSPLREPLDRRILDHINSPSWQTTLAQYLGR